MPNFRIQIPNAHFHKHWHDQAAHKGRIRTWFNQAARKHRRRENRLAKAQRVFPRPVSGLVRPVVRCQTIRYNTKKRAGKGFTLQELKEAKVNRSEALGLGISIDHRRKNRSEQVCLESESATHAFQLMMSLIILDRTRCSRGVEKMVMKRCDGCTHGVQSLRENVARLQQYKANLIVFPKRNRRKPMTTDSSPDELAKAEQVLKGARAARGRQ